MPRERHAPSRTVISPPLPLPVHFTLLPSLLPNRALTPLLYVLIVSLQAATLKRNNIPVYLTLSPTHPPHLSLLPLLLALLPTSPIHLIRQIPTAISLELDGVAPWEDLWLPLSEARGLCVKLGVERLFCDDRGSGLLGNAVEQAVSWEEEGMICHNWIPSQAAIAASAYSLDTLLGTPIPGLELISNDRYIITRMDASRKAKILHEEFENPSKIRAGLWAPAWPLVLRWSLSTWKEYLLYPPSRLKPASTPSTALAIQQLVSLLPSLTNETFRPSYAPTVADLGSVILSQPLSSWGFIPWIIGTVLAFLWHLLCTALTQLNPFRGSKSAQTSTPSFAELKRRELLARVNLGLAEAASMVMVNLWRLSQDLATRDLAKGESSPTIVLQMPLPLPSKSTPTYREKSHVAPSSGAEQIRLGALASAEDEIDRLEKRRGGSPPLLQTNAHPAPVPPPDRPQPWQPVSNGPPTTNGDVEQSSEPSDSESARSPAQVVRLMRSEDTKEWWMYYTFVGVILAALALGMAT